MRALRLVSGRPAPPEALGAVLVRDLVVAGQKWPKGRRLSAADLARVADPTAGVDAGPRGLEPGAAPGFRVLVLEPAEIHEDDAALRLAACVAGGGVVLRGPAESRVDLVAAAPGVVHVRVAAVTRIDRIDPLAVFTLLDGQVVREGEVVGSVKIGPHAVPASVLERGVRLASRSGPLVWVAPFVPRRVAALVKETLRSLARARFEEGMRTRVRSLGSDLVSITYVPDDELAVTEALRPLVRGRRHVDLVLTAGAASTDPEDALYVAVGRLGGRIVRHGVPAHPGSMVWLARVHATDLLGLPSCGAYSKATAADLLLPRLLTGERASEQMAAALGHGGILGRAMRFRFPPYAQDFDPPQA